jgi:hypothetical protein
MRACANNDITDKTNCRQPQVHQTTHDAAEGDEKQTTVTKQNIAAL